MIDGDDDPGGVPHTLRRSARLSVAPSQWNQPSEPAHNLDEKETTVPKYRASLQPRQINAITVPGANHSVTAIVDLPESARADGAVSQTQVVISHGQVFEEFVLPRRMGKHLRAGAKRASFAKAGASGLASATVPATDEFCAALCEAVRAKYGQDLLSFEEVREVAAARTVGTRSATPAAGAPAAAVAKSAASEAATPPTPPKKH